LRFRFPEVCAAMFAAHKKGNLKGSQGGKVWGKQSPWPKGQKRDGDKAAESRQSICNNNKLFTARELASKQALTFRGGHEHEHGLGKWTWSCGHGRKDVQGDMQFPFFFLSFLAHSISLKTSPKWRQLAWLFRNSTKSLTPFL